MKKSRKKLLMSIAGIALSIIMLGITALAATENITGYNKFKEFIINSMVAPSNQQDQAMNMTMTTEVTIQRDRTEMANISSVIKYHAEGSNNFISTVNKVKSAGSEIVNESWAETGKTGSVNVSKNADDEMYKAFVYDYADLGMMNEDFEDLEEEYYAESGFTRTPAQERLMNAVLDLIAGDTKSHFRSDNNTVSVRLEGAQIPELAQLALTVFEEQSRENRHLSESQSDAEFQAIAKACFGDLKDLRFEAVYAEIEFEDSTPKNAKADVIMSGVDINGVRHTINAEASMTQSDVGSTVADKINLEDISDKVIIEKPGVNVVVSNGYSVNIVDSGAVIVN